MAKNFDQARSERRKTREERTFTLGGETFVCKPAIKPEWLAPYEDMSEETPLFEVLTIADNLFLHAIEPNDGAQERYQAIRSNEDDPIDFEDLREVLAWIMEIASSRPTGPRDASSPSRGTSGTPSTDASSSPDVQAA